MTVVVKTTGGRAEAGFGNEDNDCTVVAMMYAFGLTYQQAHDVLKFAGRTDGCGFRIDLLLDGWHKLGIGLQGKYVVEAVGRYYEGYRIKQFIQEHPQGTYIIHTRGHVSCWRDGFFYDTYGGRPYYRNHSIMYYYKIGEKIRS